MSDHAESLGEAVEPRDRGSAVLLVLATMTIAAVFASVALQTTISTLRFSDRQADWNRAFAAAEAGVADYLARLNRDENYWRTVDCTNTAMKKRTSACSAWSGAETTVGWAKVPGSRRASFHYDVDVARTSSTGTVQLTSTGKVGALTRSIRVYLRRDGFGEFLYYTVYETVDPANEATYGASNGYAQQVCPEYRWAGRPTATSSDKSDLNRTRYYCQAINFTEGDRINGPLHSNDSILVNGAAQFNGTVTTSMPSCRAFEGSPPPPATSCYVGSGRPSFARGIAYRPEIELPTSIGDLKQYVLPTAERRGCLYTGPTRIRFLQPSAGTTPRMQVWSKWTTAADLAPGCGTAGTGNNQLGSAGGQTVTVPQDTLIMVQDVPSSRSTPRSNSCLYDNGIGDGIPWVTNTSSDFDANLLLAESSCRYGTAYVQGKLKGRVTVATDNNIVVTGDLTYVGGETGTDSLGLVAKNSVKVYHPLRCTRWDDDQCVAGTNIYATSSRPGTQSSITVQAAILTLQHSFVVQYYELGAKLGTLKVFGSISQRFRGPVGTGGASSGTGYLKNYNYDTRLRYAPPPYFLDPVRSGWGQKAFGEVAPLYR